MYVFCMENQEVIAAVYCLPHRYEVVESQDTALILVGGQLSVWNEDLAGVLAQAVVRNWRRCWWRWRLWLSFPVPSF